MPEHTFLALGDRLTKSLITGDFALYRSIMTLPVKFTPRQGKAYVLHDAVALREDFELYVSIIKLHGVTDIYRQLLGHLPGDDAINVRWMTHILVRATLLVEPFETRMRLVKPAEDWRIAEIESSEGHLDWALGRAKVSPDGIFETRE